MVERDFGEATIVYEDPDEGTVEWTRQNEHIAYFQDHWIVRVDESDDGPDEVRRIPTQRVYYVERSVDEFEEEVSTLRDQVQSFADDLQAKILGGGSSESGSGGRGSDESGLSGGRGGSSGSRSESGNDDQSESGDQSGSDDQSESGDQSGSGDEVGSEDEQGP